MPYNKADKNINFMVIFVAGLVGVGKTTLAEKLSEELGIYHYDIDEIKKEVYPQEDDFEYKLKNNITFSEETRIKTFEKVLQDFEKLSEKHSDLVVDETLYKKSTRQMLFEGAEKYFDDYILIWVKLKESKVKERLEQDRENHMLDDPFGKYLSLKKDFDKFKDPDIVFENNKPLEESTKELVQLVKNKVDI